MTTPPSLSGARGLRCTRHQWSLDVAEHDGLLTMLATCARCGKSRDPELSRRGRNNRKRGGAVELEVCRLLGISRVGHFGGKADGGTGTEWLSVSVKSGGVYPERIDALLRSLPAGANQLRAVVHADTPGPGRTRRMLISLDLHDFASWFGKGGPLV